MITSRSVTRTVFNVICGTCGADGPDGYTEKEAHQAAVDEGWEYRTIYPGGEMATVYTCTACVAEKEQNEG